MYFFKNIYSLLTAVCTKVVPLSIRMKLDPEHSSITGFMEFAASSAGDCDKVLDAGAGSCPYRALFSHCQYESTDVAANPQGGPGHAFLCSIDNIPRPDNSYDIIINTQVLEHVEYPQRVITEFHRVLKPGGRLFLTAPQSWGIHDAPNHFYNFTQFGLASLFNNAGFQIVFIQPRGGIFWYLSKIFSKFPFYLFSQYKERTSILLILAPFLLIAFPLTNVILPLIFYYVDRLDKSRDFTLGYSCYCRKAA